MPQSEAAVYVREHMENEINNGLVPTLETLLCKAVHSLSKHKPTQYTLISARRVLRSLSGTSLIPFQVFLLAYTCSLFSIPSLSISLFLNLSVSETHAHILKHTYTCVCSPNSIIETS